MYIALPINAAVLRAPGGIICTLSNPNRFIIIDEHFTHFATYYTVQAEIEACNSGKVSIQFVSSNHYKDTVSCSLSITAGEFHTEHTARCTQIRASTDSYSGTIAFRRITTHVAWLCKIPDSVIVMKNSNPQCFMTMLQQLILLKWCLPVPQDIVDVIMFDITELYRMDERYCAHVCHIISFYGQSAKIESQAFKVMNVSVVLIDNGILRAGTTRIHPTAVLNGFSWAICGSALHVFVGPTHYSNHELHTIVAMRWGSMLQLIMCSVVLISKHEYQRNNLYWGSAGMHTLIIMWVHTLNVRHVLAKLMWWRNSQRYLLCDIATVIVMLASELEVQQYLSICYKN